MSYRTLTDNPFVMAVWYSFLSFWQAQAISESEAKAGPVETHYDVHCNMKQKLSAGAKDDEDDGRT